MWKRFIRIVRNHRRIHKLSLNAYDIYHSLKLKRKFQSRIGGINTAEYLNSSQKPNLNVIIIVIDSLSNSHMSDHGYFRKTTPFMDSINDRFTAISASSWTYPSVASILTGLYPHNHNAINRGEIHDFSNIQNLSEIREDILSLPEMLFLLGYEIYYRAVIPPAVWAMKARVIPKRYDGFEKAEIIFQDFQTWISKKKGKRFFGYIHLADLHLPLNPPEDFRDFFGSVKNSPETGKYKWQLIYDNTLRYVDSAIGGFFLILRKRGYLIQPS